MDKDEQLKAKAKAISSVKSVGEKTTMTLLALMPKLQSYRKRNCCFSLYCSFAQMKVVRLSKGVELLLDDTC
ncbi:hypothetical protein AGMMS50222_10110 [Endomicrobiia bacterium]|nr:hypothetical protein AGMMS50222_10110 [Endomicrobiia bacterium]